MKQKKTNSNTSLFSFFLFYQWFKLNMSGMKGMHEGLTVVLFFQYEALHRLEHTLGLLRWKKSISIIFYCDHLNIGVKIMARMRAFRIYPIWPHLKPFHRLKQVWLPKNAWTPLILSVVENCTLCFLCYFRRMYDLCT